MTLLEEIKKIEVNALRYIGRYTYQALKEEAPREVGLIAETRNAMYVCDGKYWVVIKYEEEAVFHIKSKVNVAGRGTIFVIDNSENIPITMASKVLHGSIEYSIRGIEKWVHGDEYRTPCPKWGICISENINPGDNLYIKLNRDN